MSAVFLVCQQHLSRLASALLLYQCPASRCEIGSLLLLGNGTICEPAKANFKIQTDGSTTAMLCFVHYKSELGLEFVRLELQSFLSPGL